MLRIEVSEAGQAALPAVDVDDAVIIVGSSPTARIRLPATAAQPEHVRIEAGCWRALAPVKLIGDRSDGGLEPPGSPRKAGDIGEGVMLDIGGYVVSIVPSPQGAVAAPMQRTESLARELMRNLLGSGAQPTLEIERGAHAGAKRALAPPESTLVIGRGDEANWIIADSDLSRTHAEVRRGWDGVRIVDLDSKNGTRVDGDKVTCDGMALRDGCVIELGPLVIRFRDPAEKHLQGDAPAFRPLRGAEKREAAAGRPSSSSASASASRPSALPFYIALVIMMFALAGLFWVLSS